MALKQLMLRKRLEAAETAAENHRSHRAALDERQTALVTREQAAEAALNEVRVLDQIQDQFELLEFLVVGASALAQGVVVQFRHVHRLVCRFRRHGDQLVCAQLRSRHVVHDNGFVDFVCCWLGAVR